MLNRIAATSKTLVAVASTLAVCLFAHAAQAQLAGTGTTNAQVDLTFAATVTGSIQLDIVGSATTTLGAISNTMMPSPSTATINLGSFDALNPNLGATNCRPFVTTSGTPGAICATMLSASVTYNGATTAAITVRRLNPVGAAPDVPLANLRVASPPLATWTASTNGTQVPSSVSTPFNICTAQGAPTCVNGTLYDHELAVFIPRTQAPGPFSTTVVYTATSP